MPTINTKVTVKHPRGVVQTESASTATNIVDRATLELGSLAAKQSLRATRDDTVSRWSVEHPPTARVTPP